jgi:hypothetical protein
LRALPKAKFPRSKLVEATDWKLRVNGHRSGPIVTSFPNHLPEGIINPLENSGGSEVLGPWANCVDQDKTSFESLYEVVLLYLRAAIKWLETEYGTNFATGTGVDPVKLLSISDFVNATGTAQRSAERRPRCKEANLPHSPQRRPQTGVWRHSGRRTQAAVVAIGRGLGKGLCEPRPVGAAAF